MKISIKVVRLSLKQAILKFTVATVTTERYKVWKLQDIFTLMPDFTDKAQA